MEKDVMFVLYLPPIWRFTRQVIVTYYTIAKFVAWLLWLSFLDLASPLEAEELDPWNRTDERDTE